MSKATLNHWIRDDPEFADLLDEIHWHKKNWVEQHLMHRLASGDSAATIFANRTLNRDRGYNDKIQLEHSGEVSVHHQVIAVDDLSLPIDVRKKILEALRKRDDQIIDAEHSSNGGSVLGNGSGRINHS